MGKQVLEVESSQQYIYIVQASLEPSKCKIGKTNSLERRLKEYNSMTGKSKENVYNYLFTCHVKDMTTVENGIKEAFIFLREEKSKEIYFYNNGLFEKYVGFIKNHPLFIKELLIKIDNKKEIIKIITKTTPSLKERGLSQKEVIQKAKNIKNDEFYTRYEDVEQELDMYSPDVWLNKVVFCNCDDAAGIDATTTSAFASYFLKNFSHFGLKKLICTHYGGKVDLFNQGSKGYIFTKEGFTELKDYPPGYDGSFDSPLSLKILHDEADIVCTNPPFSRAIDYWKMVVASGKNFIIISNITNAINTAFIPYFQHKQAWAGYNRVDWFLNPKREPLQASGHWYTNLAISNRPKYKNLKIVPLEQIPPRYQKYDDSGVLLVDNCYIPASYSKPFAVSARPILNGLLEKGYKIIASKRYTPYLEGKECFARVLVQAE